MASIQNTEEAENAENTGRWSTSFPKEYVQNADLYFPNIAKAFLMTPGRIKVNNSFKFA